MEGMHRMMRQSLLWLSEQKNVFNFVRSNGVARQFASRFVAGEGIADAVTAAETLARKQVTSSLDLLGESVTQGSDAEAAAEQYVRMVDEMAARGGLEVNVSLKLTQMGFDLDEELCRRNVVRIVERAAGHQGFVRLDMEGSVYTQRTLDFFARHIHPNHGAHCGVVIQSALRRSDEDIERLIAMQARVRLCKGAYLEPAAVAYPEKPDVDEAYRRLMERLLERGNYPALATHDEAMLGHARKFVQRQGIAPERYEFQMLYGVRRDLQDQLRQSGHRMRVYIPFGTQWYPYLMRRLAERPANIAMILGNIVKESVPGL
jgi:proline dehydrogenase